MTSHPHLERCLTWIEKHPKTMLYLLAVTTANFVLEILNDAGVI